MECFLVMSGVDTVFLSEGELSIFIKFMKLNKPKEHYEIIKCVKNRDVFFITGKKFSEGNYDKTK